MWVYDQICDIALSNYHDYLDWQWYSGLINQHSSLVQPATCLVRYHNEYEFMFYCRNECLMLILCLVHPSGLILAEIRVNLSTSIYLAGCTSFLIFLFEKQIPRNISIWNQIILFRDCNQIWLHPSTGFCIKKCDFRYANGSRSSPMTMCRRRGQWKFHKNCIKHPLVRAPNMWCAFTGSFQSLWKEFMIHWVHTHSYASISTTRTGPYTPEALANGNWLVTYTRTIEIRTNAALLT